MSVRAWILASRPKTLAAGVAPVLIATGLALRDRGTVPWLYALCALLGAVFIQIATNFINDALDYKKGADTTERLGPLRVTQAGLLSAEAVLRGAYVCFAIAALFGIPLILRGGWPLLLIGLASIVSAYAYTGGPYPLAYHGLGELFVMVFFGLVAVGGTYYVLTRGYNIDALLCGVAAGSLAVAILTINNVRDIPSDRASNKRTMAVRLGARGARAEVVLFTVAAFASIVAIAWRDADWSLLLVLATMPLAAAIVLRVYRTTGAALNRALAMAGALEWLFSILFVIGCLIR